MANLTAVQVNDLADNLYSMAQVVGKYRYKKCEHLIVKETLDGISFFNGI